MEVDVEQLFRDRTIHEIVRYEQQLKSQAEDKRKELRELINNRYQEIIQTSDAIHSMRTESAQIAVQLSQIKGRASMLMDFDSASSSAVKRTNAKTDRSTEDDSLVVLCAQVKLIQVCTQQIYLCIDQKSPLMATAAFFLASHVGSDLQLNAHSWQAIQNRLPYAVGLIKSVGGFRAKIIKFSNDYLNGTNVQKTPFLQSILSLVLLRQIKVADAFSTFLSGCKSTIHRVLTDVGDAVAVSERMFGVAQLLLRIFQLLHSAFDVSSPNENLHGVYLESSNIVLFDAFLLRNTIAASGLFQRLPASLRQFRLSNAISEAAICDLESASLSKMQTDMNRWFEEVAHIIRDDLSAPAAFLSQFRSLAICKQSFYSSIAAVVDRRSWTEICMRVFGREVHVWRELFNPIVERQFDEVAAAKFKKIAEVFDDELATLLSAKVGASIPEKAVIWQGQAASTGRLQSSGALPSLVPRLVRRALRKFERAFAQEITADLAKFFDVLDSIEETSSTSKRITTSASLNEEPVAPKVYFESRVSAICQVQLIEKMFHRLDETLRRTENDLPVSVSLFWLLSQQLQCTALIDCLSKDVSTSASAQAQFIAKLNESIARASDQWSNLVAEQFSISFSERFPKTRSQLAYWYLNNSLEWQTSKLVEEGSDMESEIVVPCQLSVLLHDVLLDMCELVSATVGPAIHKRYLNQALYGLVKNIADSMNKLVFDESDDERIEQNISLQLWFDAKFLLSLVTNAASSSSRLRNGGMDDAHREVANAVKKSLQQLLSKLESSFIDPFDLSVFQPQLTKNVSLKRDSIRQLLALFVPPGVRQVANEDGEKTESRRVLPLCSDQQRAGCRTTTSRRRFTLFPTGQNLLRAASQADKLQQTASATVTSSRQQLASKSMEAFSVRLDDYIAFAAL